MALSIKYDEADRLRADIQAIQKRVARLPMLDARAADDILDYDEHGVPR